MLMLLFYAGSDRYACDSGKVLKVIPKISIQKMPHTYDYIAGLIDYGGNAIPVIDYCQLVIGRPSIEALHSRIILFKVKTDGNDRIFGLLAEKVVESYKSDLSEFVDVEISKQQAPFLEGVKETDFGVVQFVDVQKLYRYTLVDVHG